MTSIGKYLDVEPLGVLPGAKTHRWQVRTKGGDTLGFILWFSRWRQYSLAPVEDSVWSSGCLQDVAAFIKAEMARRRSPKEKGANIET
jgi:hypothetical protein